MNPETFAALRGVSAATATMWLLKNKGVRRTGMTGLQPLQAGGGRVVGRAYTLRFTPMREDLATPAVLADPAYPARRAIEETPEGAILVVDARGVLSAGVIGDILATRLQRRGVAAFVTDGAVRDANGIIASGLAVWAAGRAPHASLEAHSAGDVECPIGCGGVAVVPGDVLICDDDGVTVCPAAFAEELAAEAPKMEAFEEWALAQVAAGRSIRGLYPPDEETRAAYERMVAN